MKQELKLSLNKIAAQIINEEVGLLEGVREVLKLVHDSPEEETKPLRNIILNFSSIDSQTDHIPGKKVQNLWEPEVWKKKQLEKDEYIRFFKEDILSGAKELLEICKS